MKKAQNFFLCLIAVVGLIAYSNTFSSPFLFDDITNISENSLIKNLDNFIFPAGGYKGYLPRSAGFFTFALNYYFGGLDVTGYHIVNLVIHITNAILVYFLVILTFKTPYFRGQGQGVSNNSPSSPLKLSGDRGGVLIALFSALIFVSHPVQTQAVTYVVQRLTSLAAMFYLFSIVMYINARLVTQETKGNGQRAMGSQNVSVPISYFFLSLIFTVLAMLTKEMSFTLPLVIILYEFTFFRSSLKKKLIFLLPLLVTLIIIPLGIMGIDKPVGEILSDLSERIRVQTEMSRWDYLFTQFRVIVTYIRLLFLPVNQNLDYDYPVYNSFFTPPVFLSFLLLIFVIGVGVNLMYKSRAFSSQQPAVSNNPPASPLNLRGELNGGYRLIAFGIFWFFITLSVESSFIPIVDVIFEHRVYLPSAGAFIAFSSVVLLITERLEVRLPQIKNGLLASFALIVITFSITTYSRNKVWQDELSLWQDVVNKSPKNARANNNLGASYNERDMPDRAVEYFLIALRLRPDYVDAYNNLGIAFYKKGLNDLAKKQFMKALGLNPNSTGAYNNLSIVYASEGLYNQAIEYAKKALELNPDYAEAHNSLGVAYGSKEMYDQALEQFSLALKLKPNYFEAQNNLAVAQKKLRPLQRQ